MAASMGPVSSFCVAAGFLMLLVVASVVADSSSSHSLSALSALVSKTISQTENFTIVDELYSSQLDVGHAKLARSSFGYCEKLRRMSLKRLHQSLSAIKTYPTSKHKVDDIQTWLSSVITFHEACRDSILSQYSFQTSGIVGASRKMDHLTQLASTALALTNNIATGTTTDNGIGTSTSTGANSTVGTNTSTSISTSSIGTDTSTTNVVRKNKFPAWLSPRDRKLLQNGGGGGSRESVINANVVVAKDGTGHYSTVSAAIKAAPGGRSGGRFVIYVKAGTYEEKIHTNKDGITLVGDGKYATVIVGSDSVKGGSSMPDSATFTITGDEFMAIDIGFQNAAGPAGEQALALYVASDHAVFYRCSITGYQDTLFAVALRQFYRECDITGTIDFIFGNAAAVFQSCNLGLRRPRSGNDIVILANGRTDPGQTTGFSLHGCRIFATAELAQAKGGFESYLGRPWKKYSRAVVMESAIDGVVSSKGWAEWPGQGSYSKTLYFGEFGNSGPGSRTSGRVQWPGFRVMGVKEADGFTVGNLIGGNSWLPSTGVAFAAGLQLN
ncbi:Probable pectinesterase/pectinesterase inhibitor 54 [Linum grandiflorum]